MNGHRLVSSSVEASCRCARHASGEALLLGGTAALRWAGRALRGMPGLN